MSTPNIAERFASVQHRLRSAAESAGRPADSIHLLAVSKKKPAARSPDLERLEQDLTETLCAPVRIKHSSSGKGQVTIRYTSLDELDGLLERFRR